MDDDRTRGWLMARVELAIAVIAVLVFPIWFIADPYMFAPMFGMSRIEQWARYVPVLAEAVMLLALAWMIRIWRGPTRDAPPVWRYRESE